MPSALVPGHDSRDYEGNSLNGDRQPVVYVSWKDAQDYIRKLNQKSGRKYRLPTEAEWEYAARGGTTTERFWGSSSDDACEYGNVADKTAKRQWSGWTIHNCDDGYAVSAPVGSFRPNGYGLYDMLGNVWEWCQDWYDSDYYSLSPRHNPVGPSSGSSRVNRGGGFYNRPGYVRAANRFWDSPGSTGYDLGFRLALSVPGK
ncbi:MAG: hypothetical protein CSA21_02530 [Deltaproteobacteria bacterium]|nr:MAG: hypothetical protein CSA21_02530 [Deltaproteobacteria bacterium]